MVLINKAINEVTVKLVYYGPGLCGKTTNLEQIYKNPKLDNKGKMISMATETDRTLFFDFMPMELGTIGGQKVRVQLYTVPGQVFYDATRKLVLRGADGVVFVTDSQRSMESSNLESLENLRANLRLNRLDPDKVGLVFQYNKRDLPDVATVEEMNAYMQPGSIPVVEAAALRGDGVTATLRSAITRILDNLKNNVDITLYDEPPLRRPQMGTQSGATSSASAMSRISVTNVPNPVPPAKTYTGAIALPAPPAPPPRPAAVSPEPRAPAPAPVPPPPVRTTSTTPIPAPHQFSAVDEVSPFAESATAADSEGSNLQEMLTGARTVVRQLEAALDAAKRHEAVVLERSRRR